MNNSADPLETITLTPKEQEFLLKSPEALRVLMVLEDMSHTENSLEGATTLVGWPTTRYTQFQERGREIIEETGPLNWPLELCHFFGVRRLPPTVRVPHTPVQTVHLTPHIPWPFPTGKNSVLAREYQPVPKKEAP